MILKIKRSGGFAGVDEELATVDTSSLPGEAAVRVEHCLADIISLLEETPDYPPYGADMFQYEIEVIDESGEPKTLVLVDEIDDTIPLTRALGDFLNSMNVTR